jgi:protein-disulfide isomerase
MNETKQSLGIPAAIVLAGLVVAGAIYFTGRGSGGNISTQPTSGKPIAVDVKTDHILGNPKAPVTILEYSDTECPYCKRFHQTMQRIMSEYGKDGKVNWVYRHLPFHKKAPREALATECAFDQGGNEKFWQYLDKIYEITPGNDGLADSELPNIAETVGLDKTKFLECLNSARFDTKINAQANDARASGGQATPFNFIIVNGDSLELQGALPYENLKAFIDQSLKI